MMSESDVFPPASGTLDPGPDESTKVADSSHSPSSLDRPRPQPRPEKSAEEAARIRRLNRRREYLERNPAYFDSVEHELADPLLYDTLIRRFQSAEEREADGRRKGYGRVLETSLLRGEAKLARIAESYVDSDAPSHAPHLLPARPSPPSSSVGNGGSSSSAAAIDAGGERRRAGETNFSVEADVAAPPAHAEEGRERWREFLRDRFVNGEDDEFDYDAVVDSNEDFDVQERRDAEDAWFENEEPGWASDEADENADGGDGAVDGSDGTKMHGIRTGETGVQDF